MSSNASHGEAYTKSLPLKITLILSISLLSILAESKKIYGRDRGC